jgi:hypothetical protein
MASNHPPTDGLDEFSSEPTQAMRAEPSGKRQSRNTVWLLGLLSTAVLLEAVPTALWLRSTLRPAEIATVDAPSAEPTSAALIAALPCEPTSNPSETASAPVPVPVPAPVPPASAAAAAPPVAPRALAGSLSISAPVPMRVFERGRLIGTTEAETMMLSVGTHELSFANDEVGYRVQRTVTVQAGQTSTVRLEPPVGVAHINAVPWAEVWVDDQRVGETPIGNLKIPIGTRQIVFRHPELGERRTTLLVTLLGPARVSMDLRNK